ncbi:DNA-directed RNA polymerase II family protein [Salix suchowensis]|nr:DNA-directed RNA polymerase II family protein [Salix suchowensis]
MSTMKFCRECNNILYPREDRDQKILLYACRNCDHQEIADDNCVYRNEVHHSVAERTQVLQDVAADPTLPRTKAVTCTVCKHPEAVFFQATSRGEEGMTLFLCAATRVVAIGGETEIHLPTNQISNIMHLEILPSKQI